MASLDAATIQIDGVLSKEPDIKLPGDSRPLGVACEGVLQIEQCRRRGHGVDGAVPLDRRLQRLAPASGQEATDVLNRVASRAQSDKPLQALDGASGVVAPHLVQLDGMPRTDVRADLAAMRGDCELVVLQPHPRLGPHVGSDVAVPTAGRDEFKAEPAGGGGDHLRSFYLSTIIDAQ